MPDQTRSLARPRRDPPPTSRQVYALAHALADHAGVPWPATRSEISLLIDRLRAEAEGDGAHRPARV